MDFSSPKRDGSTRDRDILINEKSRDAVIFDMKIILHTKACNQPSFLSYYIIIFTSTYFLNLINYFKCNKIIDDFIVRMSRLSERDLLLMLCEDQPNFVDPCLYRLLKLISYTSTLKIKISNFWFFHRNRWLLWLVIVTLFIGSFMDYSILGILFDLVQNKKFELLKITNFMLWGIYLTPGSTFFLRSYILLFRTEFSIK